MDHFTKPKPKGQWLHPITGKPIRGNKGPKRFTFTYADLAKATKMKIKSVVSAASRGDFDPDDLVSLGNWIALKSRRLDRAPETTPKSEPLFPGPLATCQCAVKKDGFVPSQRAFFCLACGLVTRRI